jgi:hypothetical protein
MESEEIMAKIKNKEEAYKQAQEKGDIFFPFAVTEIELTKLKRELRFAKAREWADWYNFMIPKSSVLMMLDELRMAESNTGEKWKR